MLTWWFGFRQISTNCCGCDTHKNGGQKCFYRHVCIYWVTLIIIFLITGNYYQTFYIRIRETVFLRPKFGHGRSKVTFSAPKSKNFQTWTSFSNSLKKLFQVQIFIQIGDLRAGHCVADGTGI